MDFQKILDVTFVNLPSAATKGKQLKPLLQLDEQEMVQVRRGLVLALVGGRKYDEAVAAAIGWGEEEEEGVWFAGLLKQRLDQVAGEAMGLLEGGKFAAAVDMYGDALTLEEMYVTVGGGRRRRSLRVGRAMANEALERVRLALEDYREVVAMGGVMVGWKGCGRCLLEIGELGEAYEMYRRALTEDPTCQESIERMGVIKDLRQEVGDGWAGKKGRAVEWWQAGKKAKV